MCASSDLSSKELGELEVLNKDGVTTFDFGEWKSAVASRKNDDGSISFTTIDPTNSGFEFVVGDRGGKRVLVLRDGQHEYVFGGRLIAPPQARVAKLPR
jgi:hypothetical protein